MGPIAYLRLIGFAAAGIVALALILTVKGWRDDALRLPAVERERDAARGEIARGVAVIDGLSARFDAAIAANAALDKRLSQFDARIARLSTDAQRTLAHAIPPVPACDFAPAIRGVFDTLLAAPNAGALLGAPAGEDRLPGPAAAPDAVPGRQRSSSASGRDALLPAAVRTARHGGGRPHSGAGGGPDGERDFLGLDGTAAPSRIGGASGLRGNTAASVRKGDG